MLKAYEVSILKTIGANPESRGKTKELLVSTFTIDYEDLKEI